MSKPLSPFKFEATYGGTYNVRDRRLPLPGYIGKVTKYERHYNLARPLTVRGWKAYGLDGRSANRTDDPRREGAEGDVFHTRAEAAEALARVFPLRNAEASA